MPKATRQLPHTATRSARLRKESGINRITQNIEIGTRIIIPTQPDTRRLLKLKLQVSTIHTEKEAPDEANRSAHIAPQSTPATPIPTNTPNATMNGAATKLAG